jgi:CheY-like chemotaxis protein
MDPVFRILLVEDNPGDVRLTKEALQSCKILHELVVVGNGQTALAFLRGEPPYAHPHRPDLMLLDLNLPIMDGRELLETIKNDPKLRNIPVVVLTGSAEQEDILRTYDLHANGYITKPVDTDRFFALIQKIEEFWVSVVILPGRKEIDW